MKSECEHAYLSSSKYKKKNKEKIDKRIVIICSKKKLFFICIFLRSILFHFCLSKIKDIAKDFYGKTAKNNIIKEERKYDLNHIRTQTHLSYDE